MSLLGPEGAQRRLAEIQAKIGSFSVPTKRNGAFVNALAGSIGANNHPVNPMDMGLKPDASTEDLKKLATEAAENNNIDPRLFLALVDQESAWNPASVSNRGAAGLTQLMPGTAKDLGIDPLDPKQSLAGGAKYLKQLLDRFGDERLALAAYNAGPNRVERAGGVPNIPETVAYVNKIMNKAYGTK